MGCGGSATVFSRVRVMGLGFGDLGLRLGAVLCVVKVGGDDEELRPWHYVHEDRRGRWGTPTMYVYIMDIRIQHGPIHVYSTDPHHRSVSTKLSEVLESVFLRSTRRGVEVQGLGVEIEVGAVVYSSLLGRTSCVVKSFRSCRSFMSSSPRSP